MKKRISLLFSTALYIGLIPGAPGTYASLATAAAFFLISRTYRIIPELHFSAVCLISALGMLAASETSRDVGDPDPGIVVIDEVGGQLLTYLLLPVGPLNLLLGFVFFRAFDIWKPPPIRRLEHLPGGVGILADDLLAGVYANVLLRVCDWVVYH